MCINGGDTCSSPISPRDSYSRYSSGFGIVAVLFVLASIGLLAVILMQIAKYHANLQLREKAQKDIELAAQKIKTLLLTPYHCNANFYNKAISGTTILTGNILKCTNNVCNPSAGNTSSYFPIAPSDFTLDLTDTGNTGNARIKSASVDITTAQNTSAGKPATLELTVVFEKKYGSGGGIFTVGQVNSTIVHKFPTWVRTNVDSVNATVIGCVTNKTSFTIYN